MRFRKRPVVIEAVRWDGIDPDVFPQFTRMAMGKDSQGRIIGQLCIPTPEGVMLADPGDWIITGVKGEVYPCKPDIFEATYEPA